jgi:predicted XRE-type DNA-binding protein
MDQHKVSRLRAAGWTVASAQEFLGLSDEEMAFIEIKVAFAKALRDCRTRHQWSQAEAARRLGSSQSRVAKMEAADRTVTLDLLLRSLLRLGGRGETLAALLASMH